MSFYPKLLLVGYDRPSALMSFWNPYKVKFKWLYLTRWTAPLPCCFIDRHTRWIKYTNRKFASVWGGWIWICRVISASPRSTTSCYKTKKKRLLLRSNSQIKQRWHFRQVLQKSENPWQLNFKVICCESFFVLIISYNTSEIDAGIKLRTWPRKVLSLSF